MENGRENQAQETQLEAGKQVDTMPMPSQDTMGTSKNVGAVGFKQTSNENEYIMDNNTSATGLISSENPKHLGRDNFDARADTQKQPEKSLADQKRDAQEKESAILRKYHGVFYYHGKQIIRDKRSLFCCSDSFVIRKCFVWFVEWKWFDRIIITTILLNSLLLAFTDYQDRIEEGYQSERNELFAYFDNAFSVIFLIECISKLIAMGFVSHKNSYMRDAWNWLDLFIVIISVVGWLPFFDAGSLKALRTFRILRPLRSINSMPEMRGLIQTLLSSIPGLVNVLFFLSFIFGIFAIFGVNQFAGTLYNRCRTTDGIIENAEGIKSWPMVDAEGYLCRDDAFCAAQVEEGALLKCGNSGMEFDIDPYDLDQVIDQESIQYGIVGFDYVGQGMRTIMQVLTLEGWSDLTYNYSDASDPVISVIFFIGIVLLGAFFAMNLVLGQIMESFAEQAEKRKLEKEKELQEAEEELEKEEDVPQKTKSTKKIMPAIAETAGNENQPQTQTAVIKSEAEEHLPTITKNKNISSAAVRMAELENRNDQGIPMHSQESEEAKSHQPSFRGKEEQENNTGVNSMIKIQEEQQTAAIDKAADSADSRGFKMVSSNKEDVPHDFAEDQEADMMSFYGDSEPEYEKEARERSHENGCWRCMFILVTSVAFNFFIFVLILLNTASLALYRYDMSDTKELILSWCNEFFTWAFFAEMILKIIGLGPKNYIRDSYNRFDAIVVIVSLIDWTITRLVPPELLGTASEALNAFRALRLLRVIKLARLWGALAKILRQTIESLKALTYYAGLLFLFMFIFALLGMELFAMKCKYNEDDELFKNTEEIKEAYAAGNPVISPRENFDTIGDALTTIFITILGEDWNWVMYMYVRAVGNDSAVFYYVSITYFTLIVILGNIILFSLFVAILLENFENDMKDQIEATKESTLASVENRVSFSQKLASKDFWNSLSDGFKTAFLGRREKQLKLVKKEEPQSPQSPQIVSPQERDTEIKKTNRSAQKEEEEHAAELLAAKKEENDLELLEAQAHQQDANKSRVARSILAHYDMGSEWAMEKDKKEEIRPMTGRSLCCLSAENGCRKLFWKISTHKWFENFILLLIIISTITLAVETPMDDPKGQKVEILLSIDYFMTGAFCVEAIFKIIAFGFLFTKKSYLKDSWNILDFIIVISAIAGFVLPEGVNISAVKSLRILRILRPLKIIAKNKSLQVALTSLINSVPKIFNLQVIVFFFMFLLAILQTTLLSGKFYRCNTDHLEHLTYQQQETLIVDKWDCINLGGEWQNPHLHFDDTLWSLLTLFTIQTTEGWIGVMWDASNAVGVDMQPQTNQNWYMVVVFIVLIIIISMLFLNLFVGVVIETFNMEKDALTFNHILKPSQKTWIEILIYTYSAKPQLKHIHTGSCFRDFWIDVVTHKFFDKFIMGCIIANTVVLAIKWYMMPEYVITVVEILNYIFMIIFTIEAIIKLIAMRSKYFKDGWNVFDFTVVVLTAVILGFTWAGPYIGIEVGNLGVTSTILRSLRIGRIFRLVKKAQQLQVIFQALIDSVPAMASLALLLILLIFMYSIIGVQQFGLIKIDGGIKEIEGYNQGQEAMSKHANFQQFGSAFLTLFRCATGEAWNSIMFDSARSRDILFQCRENEDYFTWQAAGGGIYDAFMCGSPWVAFTFHMSFQIIVSQVFLNIFIAIILDSFSGQNDAFDLPVTKNDVEDFVAEWSKKDPMATGYIEITELEKLMVDLAENVENLFFNKTVRQRIGNLNVTEDMTDAEVEKILRSNKYHRLNYLMALEIPTSDKYTHVWFYDVLQCMAQKVVEFNYEREKIDTIKNQLKAVKLMQFGDVRIDKSYTLEAMQITRDDDDYDQNWEVFLTGFKKLDKRIELMQTYKSQVNNCKKTKHRKPDLLYDTTEDQKEWFTTKHYYGGIKIQKIAREFIEYMRLLKQEKQTSKNFGESFKGNGTNKPSSMKASSNQGKKNQVVNFAINDEVVKDE